MNHAMLDSRDRRTHSPVVACTVGYPSGPVSLCWRVARAFTAQAVGLVVAGLLHALSHGMVAAVAALLAASIAGKLPDNYPQVPSVFLASIGLVAVFAKGAFGVVAAYFQVHIASQAAQTLRDITVQNLLASGSYLPAPRTIARIGAELREAEQGVERGPICAARAVAQLGPITAALIAVSPQLALFALLVLAPFAVVLAWVRKRWRAMHRQTLLASERLHQDIDDLVEHLELWRTYGSSRQVRKALQTLGIRAGKKRVASETMGVAISSANELLGAAALIAILVVVKFGSSVFGDRLGVGVDGGAVIAFVTIFFMAYRPLRDLGDARGWWIRARDAIASLRQIHPRAVTAQVATGAGQRLRVQHLRVPHRSPSVSFELEPGQMVALAGATGSGKTSLIRAIMGLEAEAEGQLWLDGVLLRPGQVGPGIRPFAWVPQDAPVVSGSLDDNVCLAGVTRQQASEALQFLGAHELQKKLGKQLVGNSGRTLSGGERRWVALARAFATGWCILVLDEPTVGLDAQARLTVIDALSKMKEHRGVVVSSHDPDVLQLADSVVWLDRCGVRGDMDEDAKNTVDTVNDASNTARG